MVKYTIIVNGLIGLIIGITFIVFGIVSTVRLLDMIVLIEFGLQFILPFGLIFLVLCRYNFADLEIREKGVRYGGLFTPWEDIKSFAWTGETGTTLLLKATGRFQTFCVGTGQKDEINAICLEYLPPKITGAKA